MLGQRQVTCSFQSHAFNLYMPSFRSGKGGPIGNLGPPSCTSHHVHSQFLGTYKPIWHLQTQADLQMALCSAAELPTAPHLQVFWSGLGTGGADCTSLKSRLKFRCEVVVFFFPGQNPCHPFQEIFIRSPPPARPTPPAQIILALFT